MKKIIVAVSGGPDSMALLNMLREKGYTCVVVHINYGVRATAIRDEKIVKDYCQKYNLDLEVLHVKESVTGNFQAAARDIRYKFIKEIAKKFNIKEVYIGHHLQDFLETYIIQKERNITPQYYGIKSRVDFDEIILLRPLLKWSKNELISYCNLNKVAYGIDESNLEEDYLRNRIRHQIINKMSDNEVSEMLEEIAKLNKELKVRQAKVKDLYLEFIKSYNTFFILNQSKDIRVDLLRFWFKENKVYNLSNSEYLNIIKFLKSNKNGEYYINEDFSLFSEYGKARLVSAKGWAFSYTIDALVFKDFNEFSIKKSGTSFEAVTVSDEDFPLTIRNFKEGDKIEMLYGNKRVSRWFIDNKIPLSKRRSWPIVLNKTNKVILVPGIGCNVTNFSNNPNMFVVK
ncbi:MAG TPA: tRNA lysidine(34) synthetase TilS [Erysipelotrichaceae bacterium]|nr:tRNA lysidine(34) synthetase TilS [Erysipelotrichaceae bacterium]